MLVLTRRLGETIQIGDNISVTVVRVTPTEVRLGIEAPAGTHVHRAELGSDGRVTKASEPNEPHSGA
jgi:carbon storage regulator